MRLLAVTCLILGCVLAACSPNVGVDAPRERRGISTEPVDHERKRVALEPSPDDGISFRAAVVRVIDAITGRPIPGALVSVRDAREVTANRMGIAQIPRVSGAVAVVTAYADGYIAAPPHALDVLQPNAAPLEIALAPVRLLRVRVRDSDTLAPIAGAAVTLSRSVRPERRSGAPIHAGTPIYAGTTNEDGTCELGPLRRNAPVAIRAVADGYALSAVVIDAPTITAGPALIDLAPSATLTGRVFDAGGTLAAQALVYAVPSRSIELHRQFRSDAEAGGSRLNGDWLTSATDAEGRFAISGLRRDTTYVAFARSKSLGWSEGSASLDPRSLPTDLAFRLPAPSTLVVRVRSGPGAGVVGAQVELNSRALFRKNEESRGDGSYVFKRIRPGRHRVRIRIATQEGAFEAIAPVEVAPGGTTELLIDTRAGRWLSGVVTDDLGEPIARAEIVASQVDRYVRTETRDDGTFRFQGLTQQPVTVHVDALGHAAAEIDVAAHATTMRVTIERLGLVIVRVSAPSGVAPPPTTVRMERLVGDGEANAASARTGWRGRTRPLVYDDGIAEVRYATIGRSRIVIRAEGFAPVLRVADADAGSTIRVEDVALLRGRTLRGVVQDDAGVPLAGALVFWAQGSEESTGHVQAGVDGSFQLSHLSDDPVAIVVSATEEYSDWSQVIDFRASRGPVVVTLTPALPIVVYAANAVGALLSGRDLRCVRADEAESATPVPLRERSAEAGTYECRVPPGTWRVFEVGGTSPGTTIHIGGGAPRSTLVRLE